MLDECKDIDIESITKNKMRIKNIQHNSAN